MLYYKKKLLFKIILILTQNKVKYKCAVVCKIEITAGLTRQHCIDHADKHSNAGTVTRRLEMFVIKWYRPQCVCSLLAPATVIASSLVMTSVALLSQLKVSIGGRH